MKKRTAIQLIALFATSSSLLVWLLRANPQTITHLRARASRFVDDQAFGESDEDRFLLENVFAKRRNGFFVEVGAGDGFHHSNTFAFESQYNWTGVLIEASPAQFAKLQENRPNAVLLNKAVCADVDSRVDFVENMEQGEKSGVSDTLRPELQPGGGGEQTRSVKVACASLGDLLRTQGGVKRVDLLSIDLNGGELAALKTMDWTIHVDSILIAVDGSNPQKDAFARELLTLHGFVYEGRVGSHSDLWRSRTAVALKAPMAAPPQPRTR